MADKKPTCFVIMPMSVPDHLLSSYGGESDHFRHVLDVLFAPAVERCGMEVIRPEAKGADIIHGKIVTDLQRADLVLCDMSILNANVFFELGIRVALDKPICLVRDDLTTQRVFDTDIINRWTYRSTLKAWEIGQQVEGLADHINASLNPETPKPSLWRIFGMEEAAKPPNGSGSTEEMFAVIRDEFASLRGAFRDRSPQREPETMRVVDRVTTEIAYKEARDLLTEIGLILKERGIEWNLAEIGPGIIGIDIKSDLDPEAKEIIDQLTSHSQTTVFIGRKGGRQLKFIPHRWD